jgi:hypothetical protein
MLRTRLWWNAAGLLLAASPALAQDRAARDVLADAETLPVPRISAAPAAVNPACGQGCADKDGRSWWQRWQADKHAWCQAHLWGYHQEFEAPPLGAVVHTHFRTMVANGEAASMVLYHYDFIDGSDRLNLHGRDRLCRMTALLHGSCFPLVIERTPEAPNLAESRRTAILNVLAMNSITVPPERVVIGSPIAAGLSGIEAERIQGYFYLNMAVQGQPLQFQTGGGAVGGGGGAGGSFGAGGGFGAGR